MFAGAPVGQIFVEDDEVGGLGADLGDAAGQRAGDAYLVAAFAQEQTQQLSFHARVLDDENPGSGGSGFDALVAFYVTISY